MADNRNAVETIESFLSDGKKNHTAAERRQFTEAWVEAAKKGGITDTTVEYLYKGFSIGGAAPLYQYARDNDSEGVYKAFFLKGKFKDKTLTLKIALNLFAYELIAPTTQDSLDLVARRLCDAAMSLGKSAQRTLNSNVPTLLIRPLGQMNISKDAHIESPGTSGLANYLKPSIEAVRDREKAKRDDVRAANALLAWLDNQKNSIASFKTGSAAAEAPEETEAPKAAAPDTNTPADSREAENTNSQLETPTASGQTTAKPEAHVPANGMTSDTTPNAREESSATPVRKREATNATGTTKTSSRKTKKKGSDDECGDIDMAAVICFLTKYQKERDELEKQLESVRSTGIEASQKVRDLEQELRAAQREIDNLREHRASLSGNYSELQRECETLKAEAQSLRDELGEANEMIAMMDEGSSHEVDATMGALGRELSYDYRKFLAAADQPMTEELGGIVLGQLRTVFDILKSHGIELQ